MKPCKPERAVTCPFGKKGDSWSTGEHGGIDYGCPSGDPVYAMWGGTITDRSWGSAYGNHIVIDHDRLPDDSPGLWAAYCHLKSEKVSPGEHVDAGELIGYSDNTGNSSGSHLHVEVQPQAGWVKGSYVDPAPWVEAGDGGTSGPFVTEHVYRSKCGFGEPTNGDSDSDTVKELQERLNRTTLAGGQTLTISGRYDDDTDEEVRLWQEQVCGDVADPAGASYLGPNQFARMFPEAHYTLHDDGDAAVAGTPPENPGSAGGASQDPGSPSALGQRFVDACSLVEADVWYEEDWDDGSIQGNGQWKPDGGYLLLHHTGGENSLDWILWGGDYQPVRLANFLVDRDGTLHVCAARKSYHAGKGSWPGVPTDSMNDLAGGIEIESPGTSQDLTDAQVLTVAQLSDGWMSEFDVPLDNVINHKDWSSTGKPDTKYAKEWWWDEITGWEGSEGNPEPPDIEEPPPVTDLPESITFPLGIQYHYSGKPAGELVFSGSYKRLDVASWAPKKDGLTLGMLYANVDGEGEFRTRLVRESPNDETAYQTHYAKAGDNYLLTHVWFESGEGGRALHYEFCSMDGTTHTVTTRYAKFVTIPWEVTVVLVAAASAASAINAGAQKIVSWLGGKAA